MRCEAPGTEKEEPDMIQKVIRGRDSIRQAGEMADRLGICRPLIVGSKHLTSRLKQ